MSPSKPPLTVIGSAATGPAPPRTLHPPGLSLWTRIQAEFSIRDAGGIELLTLACEATDRASALAACIDADGLTLRTRTGIRAHPALRDECAARALAARLLIRLGVTSEQIKTPGRPATGFGWSP